MTRLPGNPPQELSIFAPAKINLYLHVTARLPGGYHALDSLVAFADIGDTITLTPSRNFTFEVDGPFSGAFSAKELDATPISQNLVVKAAWALARETGHQLDIKVRLTKNLPLGGGIGGGSADAAAVIWALLQWWNMPKDDPYIHKTMSALGADVAMCFRSQAVHVRGRGEIFDPVPPLPDMPILLVHPGKPCSTPLVFAHYEGEFKDICNLPDFKNEDMLLEFLQEQSNDLDMPAQKTVPDIGNILQALQIQNGCLFARMSGAGSTCFGLFGSEEESLKAAQDIKRDNPDWWVQAGWLNRVDRY